MSQNIRRRLAASQTGTRRRRSVSPRRVRMRSCRSSARRLFPAAARYGRDGTPAMRYGKRRPRPRKDSRMTEPFAPYQALADFFAGLTSTRPAVRTTCRTSCGFGGMRFTSPEPNRTATARSCWRQRSCTTASRSEKTSPQRSFASRLSAARARRHRTVAMDVRPSGRVGARDRDPQFLSRPGPGHAGGEDFSGCRPAGCDRRDRGRAVFSCRRQDGYRALSPWRSGGRDAAVG